MKRGLFIGAVFLLSALKSEGQSVTNTDGLLKEMHARYHGKFYKHITFVQLNKYFKEGIQTEGSVWYEAFEYPGKLRVDYGPTVGKDGFISLNDSIYHFKDGKLDHKEKKLNETMLLQGDIYCLPIPSVIEKLKVLGYDISKFREDTWNNKPVYVVGAEKGDETTRQFWIDKEFLYMVKQIINDNGSIQEIHFTEHAAKGKFYIEDEVRIMENGKIVRSERYAEVNHDIVLQDAVFDPKSWSKVHWKKK